MITEQGIVQEMKKRYAFVKVQKSAACNQCSSRGTCDISNKDMIIEVLNELQAKEGDLVEISMPEKTLLKVSFLVYFLPIIALLVGAFSGNALAGVFHINSTLASLSGGFLLMGLIFYFLIRQSKSAEYQKRYRPRMTRIIPSSQTFDSR